MKGTISIQHQTQAVPVSQIGPSLDILLGSSYKVTDVPGCTGLTPYDDTILNKAFSLPPSVTTSTRTGTLVASLSATRTLASTPLTSVSLARSTATPIATQPSVPGSYNLSYFPRGDVIPPINPALTAAFLSGYTIPDLPPRSPGGGVDWSRKSTIFFF